jgi:hypothetical protein
VGLVGTALSSWPLLGRLSTSVLERTFWYDARYNIDAIISEHRALFGGFPGGFHDALYGGLFFYPQPRPLVVSELLPLAALAALPLSSAPLLAHNLLLLLTGLLNCVGGAAFARSLGARALPAALAGAGFAFSAYTNTSAGRLQLLFLFPVPFALAALVRWARTGALRAALAVAGWTVAAAMLCLYYALFLALLVPPLALVARLATRRPSALRELGTLAAALVVAALPTAAILWPYRDLRAHLGLLRDLREVASQGGDPLFFFWAERSTALGRLLYDVYLWDTAHYPGTVALVASTAGLALWLRPRLDRWKTLVLPLVLGTALTPLVGVTAFFVGGAAVLYALLRLARAGEISDRVPILAGLALGGLFLFLGPDPSAFGHRIGPSPYALLLRYAPFVDGLRMIRRAGILVQLALLGVAALVLSRLELKRFGIPLVGALLVLTVAESVPLRLRTRPMATACTDPALQLARTLGVRAVGETYRRPLSHPELTEVRHDAELCGVATTMGPPGFQPPLALLVDDALATLPHPSAHGWLWDAGVRHVLLRSQGDRRWFERRILELAPLVTDRRDLGDDVLLALAPPARPTPTCADSSVGAAVPVTSVDCTHGREQCRQLADGDLVERWTSRTHTGGEEITLKFAPAEIAALEWRADGFATDLPRGLRIERLADDGRFVPWAEYPSISLESVGREAVRARVLVPLPPERTSAMRIVSTGRSSKFWLSATELVPHAAR